MAAIDTTKYQLSEDGQYWEMKPEVAARYRESVKYQLDQWVAGNPIHNAEFDECCPDFSCCGSPLWDENKRKVFQRVSDEGNEQAVMDMLMGSLGEMLSNSLPEVNVVVCGETPNGETTH